MESRRKLFIWVESLHGILQEIFWRFIKLTIRHYGIMKFHRVADTNRHRLILRQ